MFTFHLPSRDTMPSATAQQENDKAAEVVVRIEEIPHAVAISLTPLQASTLMASLRRALDEVPRLEQQKAIRDAMAQGAA